MSKLLLADDEKAFRSSLAQRLRLRGYEVVEAANGREAIDAVGRDPDIDVVILDYRMPGMKGEEVLRGIMRSRPCAAVILLTGYCCVEAPGAWACLQKPCDLEELICRIESARARRPPAGGAKDGR
jgi:DNA-binding NtrC family response regulator